ncbi:hypothetical protein BKA62DRAFT_680524 [Auriculariales sp. MPI-PUGE-AT-0066]|nr:hypothetical protein BKA62DRAFT_680524 [Auriculariales sp. MPI-PUGE-AT-0066]
MSFLPDSIHLHEKPKQAASVFVDGDLPPCVHREIENLKSLAAPAYDSSSGNFCWPQLIETIKERQGSTLIMDHTIQRSLKNSRENADNILHELMDQVQAAFATRLTSSAYADLRQWLTCAHQSAVGNDQSSANAPRMSQDPRNLFRDAAIFILPFGRELGSLSGQQFQAVIASIEFDVEPIFEAEYWTTFKMRETVRWNFTASFEAVRLIVRQVNLCARDKE